MLTIKNIEVKSLSVDHLDLFWEIGDTYEDPHDYTFTVERSESAMGPFDQISEPFSDKYFFRDVIVGLFHKWRQHWYRIKITKKSDSSESYSDVVSLSAPPDLIANEVRRLELLLMREHIGRACWMFPRRTWGQRCPDCWDRVTGSRLRDQCEACYDTGYAKGYLDPILQVIQFDPSPKADQPLQVAKTQQQDSSARAPYFPPLKPNDIIVEAENRRWRVIHVSTTQRLRAVLHQEIRLHDIPKTDIEYRLPVRVEDLRELRPGPDREFSNPHNLTAVSDENWFRAMLRGHGYSE
jgi:hypothetical protein